MTIEGKVNRNSLMMPFIMSCYVAGSMRKNDNRRLAKQEFCDDDVYNVMLRCWKFD